MYNGYFEDHPPVYMLVAAYMGYKPESKRTVEDPEGFGQFLQNMPGVAFNKGASAQASPSNQELPQADNG